MSDVVSQRFVWRPCVLCYIMLVPKRIPWPDGGLSTDQSNPNWSSLKESGHRIESSLVSFTIDKVIWDMNRNAFENRWTRTHLRCVLIWMYLPCTYNDWFLEHYFLLCHFVISLTYNKLEYLLQKRLCNIDFNFYKFCSPVFIFNFVRTKWFAPINWDILWNTKTIMVMCHLSNSLSWISLSIF